ncbi:MAG: glycoside hydrolase family 26 [Bacteroidetes bacterium]|nr:glycoside hydrolase family 26 [Bacteroidota bacterium]
MSRSFIISILFILCLNIHRAQVLKSVIYDFDGFDAGATSLPEGEYSFGDLSYSAEANPITTNDMLGDRVLKMNLNWAAGYGAFGRGISRYIEFNPNADYLNFYFYNPSSNNQSANFEITLADDDDQSNNYNPANDDTWKKTVSVAGSSGWQLISIPLKDFTDGNAGGNGVFDMAFTQNKGMLLVVEFRFSKASPSVSNAVFYLDMIAFSDGILPRGNNEFQLPYKSPSDYCLLGAFEHKPPGQYYTIPSSFEGLFPSMPGKKIRYANFFFAWGNNGTASAHAIPGEGMQTLLNNGYRPILTWEPLFEGFSDLDPVQPRLNNIISGQYDSYIDAFADKIATLSDTIIIRFMHEFEGDWYSWCVSQNGNDPNLYVQAFRKVVNRFRAKGVNKVKWMWCANADYAPYRHWNWIVNAYPGDEYVDIVATDIYNNHYPVNLPWWCSFRYKAAESYYYLNKYFPNKPLFICELGCRERFSSENTSSESKGAWYARMDKELQSNFHNTRALVFFNAAPDQNWFVNTSPGAIQSLIDNVWMDDYYFKNLPPIGIEEHEYGSGLYVYPNPSNGQVTLSYNSTLVKENFNIKIFGANGSLVYTELIKQASNTFDRKIDFSHLPKGIYMVELEATLNKDGQKQNVKEVRKLVFLY